MVSSSAVSGDYTKIPFNFKNCDCNKVVFYVNGQSVSSPPFHPNVLANHFVGDYSKLVKGEKKAINITRQDYKSGYCLYVIDPSGVYQKIFLPQRGHGSLEFNFETDQLDSHSLRQVSMCDESGYQYKSDTGILHTFELKRMLRAALRIKLEISALLIKHL